MTDTEGATPPRTGPAIVVLLVDDQRFVGMALKRLLGTEADIELHCCLEASDALATANRVQPTLILQDLVLPGIDGLTLVRMFRSNTATIDTPIVVLSGNDDEGVREQSLKAGANGYMVKLPAKHELLACIRQHARRGQQVDATPVETPTPELALSADTLDPVVLAAFRQTGPGAAFTLTLIDQFMLEAETRVTTLGDAAARHDARVLKSTAHSLKGSSLIMGAKRLGALCAEVEDGLAARPAVAVSSVLMAAIREELGNVRAAFVIERQHITRLASVNQVSAAAPQESHL
jgi:DNA-binding response OmpR family regulator